MGPKCNHKCPYERKLEGDSVQKKKAWWPLKQDARLLTWSWWKGSQTRNASLGVGKDEQILP